MASQVMDGVERRQLSVLFCDLVGSTALASAMDAEDHHDLMLAFQRLCARILEDSRGFVARFAGDGVLAYFGYPLALEEASQCAVHAGLRLCEVGRHLPKPAGRPLAVRVGIATGLVIVGDTVVSVIAEERTTAGITPNMAARLQSIAEPDSVVVSDMTKRLADSIFEFRSLGSFDLKGLTSPVPAWAPIGPRRIVSRFAGRRGGGVSPLTGRQLELDEIWRLWNEARNCAGRVAGVVGEAGIGKSRLLEEARKLICQDETVTWLECGGASILDQTPFHVVTQFVPKLAASNGVDAADMDHAMGILGGELSFDDSVDASTKRNELLLVLKQWIDDAARRGPTVLAVEDLHWADPSTLEFFDRLVMGLPSPLFFIYTSRKDFTDRWPSGAQHRVLTLNSLDEIACTKLARYASADTLNLRQVESIVSLAGGFPLFIEELARLIAGRDATSEESAIPSTLAGLLAIRLEQLGPAKQYAQIAAVLGQEFSADLFASMVEANQLDAMSALAELEAHAIVVPSKSNAAGHYVFRHALFAIAAYDTLLKRQRRQLHGRAATLIVERFPQLAEMQPQLLARHWTGAGDAEKAVAAWKKAGDLAGTRHAFQEAEYAYREALAVLDAGTAILNHDRKAFSINAKLNGVLQVTHGYSSTEVSRISQRVQELGVKVGDAQSLSRQKSVEWRTVFTAGDYARAAGLADEVMELSQAQGDVLWRRMFHLRAGIQHGFYTGHLEYGERNFLAWIAIDDGSHRGAGDDALSMGIGALIAHMTGRQPIAERRMASTFEIAERRGAPYERAMALHVQSCLHHFSREPERLAESAAHLTDVAAQCGFEYARCLALGWTGVANAYAGKASLALEQIGTAVAAFERLGARVAMVFWLHILGWVYHLTGEYEKALAAYRDAMAFNHQERAFRLDAHLGRADLLSAMGRLDEAARELRHNARLSAAMGANSYRLRSLVSLARLHSSRGDETGLEPALSSIDALLQPGYCAAVREDVAALARETRHAFDLGRMEDDEVRS